MRGERRNRPIAAKAHSFDVGAKLELRYAFVLIIVPNHHFVGRILGMCAAADQREDVASKQHFNNTNAARTLPFYAFVITSVYQIIQKLVIIAMQYSVR